MEDVQVSELITLFLLVGTIWLLRPLMDALLFGMFTAYILYFLEKRLFERLDNRMLSNLIILLLLLSFLGAFIYGLSTSVTAVTSNIESFTKTVSASVSFIIEVFNLPESLSDISKQVISTMSAALQSIILSEFSRVPNLAINMFIFVVSLVYFFKDGALIRTRIYDMLDSMDDETANLLRHLLSDLSDMFRGVFLYRTFMAVAVFLLASLGLFMMGIDFWWGWALLMGVFAFVPVVTTFMVYLPLGILYMALGSFWLGVVIVVYGVIVLNTMTEMFLRPHLQTQRADEHPLLLFLGFIAGPMVLGLKGVFLGPIVFVLTKNIFMNVYGEQVND